MDLFNFNNIESLIISFIASLLVIVLVNIINTFFNNTYKKNRLEKFSSEFAKSLETILRKPNDSLTPKKLTRLYKALLLKHKINFPIDIDELKTIDLVFIGLSSDLSLDIVDKKIDELENHFKNSENELSKINLKSLSNFKNVPYFLIVLVVLMIISTIIMTLGIYYIMTKT